MEGLNGNSSDSTSFRNTIEQFSSQLKLTGVERVIADSKLYCRQTLQVLQQANMHWLTRVPHTIGEVGKLCAETSLEQMNWLDENYAVQGHQVEYAAIAQYWLVVYSKAAEKRQEKSLKRKWSKQSQKAADEWNKLQRQAFHCKEDALDAVAKWLNKQPFMQLSDVGVQQVKRYEKKGQPAKDALPKEVVYYLSGSLSTDLEAYQKELFQQSLFVLASNQQADTQQQQLEMLTAYKAQHTVERGFRFLKDPQVVASSFFVKNPQRVQALLFIMTLCLLVYSLLEYKIRKALEHQKKTVPDQKGKPTATPTARWIFHCFLGIHLLKIPNQSERVLNLKDVHLTILRLLPQLYLDTYS
jgi:transposase